MDAQGRKESEPKKARTPCFGAMSLGGGGAGRGWHSLLGPTVPDIRTHSWPRARSASSEALNAVYRPWLRIEACACACACARACAGQGRA
jgi:hypothetical protein